MEWQHVDWQDESGVRLARFCGNPDKNHTGDHWPRVVYLILRDEVFDEFYKNPLTFAWKHKLFPEGEEISWISQCAVPPLGDELPQRAEGTEWMAVILHTRPCTAACTAVPKSTVPTSLPEK